MCKKYWVLLFALCLCAGGCASKKIDSRLGEAPPKGFFYLTQPDDRANNPDNELFREEFKRINTRLPQNMRAYAASSSLRPRFLAGLALSGGGIRSNAFQLGILSGLVPQKQTCSTKEECSALYKRSLLRKFSYLSAVSGGSWAAASVKQAPCAISFFAALDAAVSSAGHCRNADTDGCTTGKRCLNSSYLEVMRGLKDILLPTRKGYTLREAWRTLLLKHHIGFGNDIPMETIEDDNDRPFLLINTTHDANLGMVKHRTNKNFPFEISGLAMGTIADCGNTNRCTFSKEHLGVFVQYAKASASTSAITRPVNLSQAIAMSGAVVPSLTLRRATFLSWNLPFPAPQNTAYSSTQRSHYIISDGGHSENLGALGLIERGLDLVVISDMGYDPKYTFDDYALLQQQSKTLLQRTLVMDKPKNTEGAGEACSKHKYHSNELSRYLALRKPTQTVFTGAYYHGTQKQGNVLYIKAPRCLSAFYEYLNAHGYLNTLNYLRFNKTAFPANATRATEYDPQLIFAYYLLGKFIGSGELRTELLKKMPEQHADSGC